MGRQPAFSLFPTRRSSDLQQPAAPAGDLRRVEREVLVLGERQTHGPELGQPARAAELPPAPADARSEEHTSELQSHSELVCRLPLEKKKLGAPAAGPGFPA